MVLSAICWDEYNHHMQAPVLATQNMCMSMQSNAKATKTKNKNKQIEKTTPSRTMQHQLQQKNSRAVIKQKDKELWILCSYITHCCWTGRLSPVRQQCDFQLINLLIIKIDIYITLVT